MSFTNVLSAGIKTRSEDDIYINGFSSSTIGRVFLREDLDQEFEGDVFCSGVIDTEFTSCLSVTTLGEC